MLLVYPPQVRSTEAPLGIALLSSFLKDRGEDCRCLDLNAEAQAWLLNQDCGSGAAGRGTALALRRLDEDRAKLLSPETYTNIDRYRRSVLNLNRVMASNSSHRRQGVSASLADYKDASLSPHSTGDLLYAAQHFEENIYYPFFSARLESVLKEFPTRSIGISLCYLSQALISFALIGFLKRHRPDIKLVLGGSIVNSWVSLGSLPERELFGGLVDLLLPGRGEDTLETALCLNEPARASLPREGSPPDFSDFDQSLYFSPSPILPYTFSSSCPWKRCTFCPEKAENAPYRALKQDAALAQLARLREKHNPELFHFTDNELSPSYLQALAASPLEVPWYGFARFSRELTDLSFCKRLAASGCRLLQLGLESADQSVLDAMGKGTRVEQNAIILENLAEAGIGAFVYVLFGTPSEDHDAALRTRDFIALHARRIGFINVAVFNMPRKSEEATLYPTRDFYEGDLSLYHEFEHPKGWNRAEIRSFLSSEFESSEAIKTILHRNPPIFTSNHAPFFLDYLGN